MTSPMSEGRVPGYGIVERTTASSDAARVAERIRLAGYAVVPGGFKSAEISDFGARLEHVMARQVEEFGGADRLASIGDTLTARCPLLYDDVFVGLAAHPTVLAICREL